MHATTNCFFEFEDFAQVIGFLRFEFDEGDLRRFPGPSSWFLGLVYGWVLAPGSRSKELQGHSPALKVRCLTHI